MIEEELVRQQCYSDFLQVVARVLQPRLKWKTIHQMMLRFVFNRLASRNGVPGSDPVFVSEPCVSSKAQLTQDLKYAGISDSENPDLVDRIEQSFSDMTATCIQRCTHVANRDQVPLFLSNSSQIKYGVEVYKDISDLARKHPKFVSNALALQIRYRYLHLDNHGLAFPYQKVLGLATTDALEGFASAFNHYFDVYCSAFPDLEAPFGSIGSFFTVFGGPLGAGVKNTTVMINPVFDETIMTRAITIMLAMLAERPVDLSSLNVTFILPEWKAYEPLDRLRKSSALRSQTSYPKGQLAFIQYMNVPPIEITPCDIVVLNLSNELTVDDNPPKKRQKIEEELDALKTENRALRDLVKLYMP